MHSVSSNRATSRLAQPRVSGYVAPGFQEVQQEFERNFAERGEIGGAVSAYLHGEKVVDLWGGYRSPERDAPWKGDTMVIVFSTTKGLSAMTLALASSRGWLDYEAPVSCYWPEFAQNGKGGITVRELLGHEAGLVCVPEQLTVERIRDRDSLAQLLARMTPEWPPGTRHGYHAMSLGLFEQELLRRVDPKHRTIGRFFHEEIARPLGLEFYIGLPPEIPDERLARVKSLSTARAIAALGSAPLDIIPKMLWPWSLLRKSLGFLDLPWNERLSLEVEVPAGNGVGTARAIARAYSAFAEGGAEIGITPETFGRLTALPPVDHPQDEILGVPTYFTLGYIRPGPDVTFGSSPRAFGHPGAGGSFAFADPDAHVGYAYVTNKMGFYLADDPREKALRDALYRAVARTAHPVPGPDGTLVHEDRGDRV
jgi:CubicO group peptidase (beta-lactamase class C family)